MLFSLSFVNETQINNSLYSPSAIQKLKYLKNDKISYVIMKNINNKTSSNNKLSDNDKNKATPFLKWAGGKTQLLYSLSSHVPSNFGKYIEPFLGGGAFFFYLQPNRAILADSNEELINCFQAVQRNVKQVIKKLLLYKNTKEFYYTVRGLEPNSLSKTERAARFIYLNRTCFNGLYRVNKKGQFNVPYGKYKNPTICDENKLLKAHLALQGAQIICQDYKKVIKKYAKPGDFIYFDPPYYPVSKYSDFKRYTKDFFYEDDHIDLANLFRHLFEKGCFVLLTNSNCEFVKELYKDFNYTIIDTKRVINKYPSRRNSGQDLIVTATKPPQKSIKSIGIQKGPNALLENFPGTRFMGSKYSILPFIWNCIKHLKFESVLDIFSGSGCVSYMFKQQGKRVISNDFLNFCYHISNSLVKNNDVKITDSDIQLLLSQNGSGDSFIFDTFKDLYFTDDENRFLDNLRTNIDLLDSEIKRSIALAAISRACLKRRPRGIFTYVGNRYNDGRKDLKLTLQEHFLENIEAFNNAVLDNGLHNEAYNVDGLKLDIDADLIYIDPPYFSPHSDNEYTRRYHFIEGLCRKWEGLEIQWKTKTKKFKRYETPFSSKNTVYDAFKLLFEKHRDKIIVVSYSSNSIPNKNELSSMLKSHKKSVEVHQVNHRYSFGNQGHKIGDNKNDVFEYVFVAN